MIVDKTQTLGILVLTSPEEFLKGLTQHGAQAQNSLVLEAIDASIEDLVAPLDGFDLVVGHASEGADDVRAETRVHILRHVTGSPREVLAPGGCFAWNGREVRDDPRLDECQVPWRPLPSPGTLAQLQQEGQP